MYAATGRGSILGIEGRGRTERRRALGVHRPLDRPPQIAQLRLGAVGAPRRENQRDQRERERDRREAARDRVAHDEGPGSRSR